LKVEENITIDIGLASDDSVLVLLDGNELHLKRLARTDGGPNAVLDVIMSASVPQLNPLTAGIHTLMVKVFEGTVDHTFRLRFQTPVTGEPVTEGIEVCLDRENCGQGPPARSFNRGDTNNDGIINLTDGVRSLNFLFLGGPDTTCKETQDFNNDGGVNITDGVATFNFLFLGGPPPVDPGPVTDPPSCGPDPDPPGSLKDLGCDFYDSC
jgi:hypothetical protein